MICSNRMPKLIGVYLFTLLSVSAIQAHSPESFARFGEAIAIGDGHLFIAEPSGFKNPGRVHIYMRGEDEVWTFQNSLQGPDARVGDGFGRAIAYAEGILAVAGPSTVIIYERQDDKGNFVLIDQLESEVPDGFGSAIALSGSWLAVSSSQTSSTQGQVTLFQRNTEGIWDRKTVLDDPGESPESMFGVALAMDQDRLLIGAPGACTAYLYKTQADEWKSSISLPCGQLGAESAYATALDLRGNHAAIGAPRHNSDAGSVAIWTTDSMESEWSELEVLTPESQDDRQFFGAQIQLLESQWIIIGAPMTANMEGEVRVYSIQEDKYVNPEYTRIQGSGPRFGSTIAGDESIFAVGIPEAAYGEGSTRLIEQSDGVWNMTQELFITDEALSRMMDQTCDGSQVLGFGCALVDLVSFLPNQEMEMNRGVRLSDIWGWTDPETGVEYGLIGHLEGTVFIDLSNPSMPKYLGTLPRTEGSPGSTWRDIKVYQDHAFIVADRAREHGMQIFDLTQLRELTETPVEFEATAHYNRIHSAHNIVINEDTGFAFAVGASAGGETCGGGLHMIDIREPQAPVFAGCFADKTTGRRKTGYSHDAQCVIYNGPDSEYIGRELCFGANETAISISDVTDKTNPVAVGTGSYPDAAYVHQGWLSEDHAYFYQNDELDELTGKVDQTRTIVWDVKDLSDPIMIREFYGPTSATDHNLYVHGNLMYQTNNASGLRIIDVSTPDDPVEIGYFDTTPYGTDEAGFNGTWSSYPYFESGIIVVTSRREGVFILKKQPIDI